MAPLKLGMAVLRKHLGSNMVWGIAMLWMQRWQRGHVLFAEPWNDDSSMEVWLLGESALATPMEWMFLSWFIQGRLGALAIAELMTF